MSEWGIALISAGSALAGGLVTGWFARSAGVRQADAARHAGDRQADALLETVRRTFEEQRTVRLLDLRRQTYLRFLEAAEVVLLARRSSGAGQSGDGPALQRALGAVMLEGPSEVAGAAQELDRCLRTGGRPDDLEDARRNFITTARGTLEPSGTALASPVIS
ncbi:hypothetical protein LHJ74_12910 [Streptomyces sp. N2-109]|uniref:Secreted protein n=1 Tax=Streptomyces gossypii TaxID=2883101 RepID=A0ABT2JSR2_9ACTN|nr:hypothetical protein [Streptomyces gossypii]MCT2590801.1 hypothetical protein [Streptomyces gossypii]